MTVYSSAIAGRGAARQPVWATQQWGCDFGGSIALGALDDDGAAHNGATQYSENYITLRGANLVK